MQYSGSLGATFLQLKKQSSKQSATAQPGGAPEENKNEPRIIEPIETDKKCRRAAVSGYTTSMSPGDDMKVTFRCRRLGTSPQEESRAYVVSACTSTGNRAKIHRALITTALNLTRQVLVADATIKRPEDFFLMVNAILIVAGDDTERNDWAKLFGGDDLLLAIGSNGLIDVYDVTFESRRRTNLKVLQKYLFIVRTSMESRHKGNV
jgi:hypothetical protein